MTSKRAGTLAVLLSVAGIGLCAWLIFIHLAMFRGELVGGAACGATGSIFNCHAVTASPLGNPLGMPLAFWGLIGYVAALNLGLLAWRSGEFSERALAILGALALTFVVVDLGLFAVMFLRIRFLCPLCLATYGVNLALLVVAKAGARKPWGRLLGEAPYALAALWPRTEAGWLLAASVAIGAAGAVAVHVSTTFLAQGPPGTLRKQMTQFVSQQTRVSVETSGDPQHGPASAAIQVAEFSDFLCPSCQRAFKFNPIIFASHRHEVSFTFKHFPLDMECNTAVNRPVHPGACKIAAATECAHEQDKFWAFHDLIFEQGPKYQAAQLDADAQRIGLDMPKYRACMDSGRGVSAVKRDVSEAIRLGVSSTPTFIINGVPVTGALTPAAFEELVQATRRSR